MTTVSTSAEEQNRTLVTADGVRIAATHRPAAGGATARGLALIVVHGFTATQHEVRVMRIIERLRAFGGVVAIDLRGHGRSGGASTVGDAEVHDVDAAVAWARELGYRRVVPVGFSLGGAVVVRQAAIGAGAVDAVVAVSAPAFWYYRGTSMTRWVHRLVLTRTGRLVLRVRGTRVSGVGWPDPAPVAPVDAANALRVPLLVIHGDVDRYFPVEHARSLERAAGSAGVRVDVWIERGLGHAEAAVGPTLVDRIGAWAVEATAGDDAACDDAACDDAACGSGPVH